MVVLILPQMEILTWTSLAAPCVALLSLLLISRHLLNRQRKLHLPPGPKPLPIIGNLHLMGPLPHRSIHNLSKKYGELMLLRFGSYPVLIGSSVKTAELILKTMDITFACRPKTAVGKYTAYNYSDITWAFYGPYWRQNRKICIMELFSPKRLESFEYIRAEEINSVVKKLYESSGQVIQLKDILSDMGMNVISRMVLGKKYLDESDNSVVKPDEFREMMDELFVLAGVFNIGDYIPWIAFLDLQGFVKRMKAVSKKFDKFLEHVLDDHNARRETRDTYVAKDMVDILLQLAEDPNLEVKLERHGIKAFTLDLIAGGTESSSTLVEWAMSEILKKPEIFEKATEELDRVIGRKRWVEEKDLPDLPYIEAITKETMRLHPVAPMLVPRCSREDCQVAGYDIPKGSQVFVNVWAIMRDPNVWDDPDLFLPERFIGKKIDAKGRDFEFLPFGAGRRMCPGYSLGTKVVQTSLANILHGFDWKLPSTMKKEDLNMEEIFGLSTPRKIPLLTIPEPRLPTALYQ